MVENETKVCTKCHLEKDLLSFSEKKTSKDGRASWCRSCFKANWEVRYYENHQHYRNSHNASRNRVRDENARRVFNYLKEHACLNCGESDPVVLEFDHRGENDKIGNISNLITHSLGSASNPRLRNAMSYAPTAIVAKLPRSSVTGGTSLSIRNTRRL